MAGRTEDREAKLDELLRVAFEQSEGVPERVINGNKVRERLGVDQREFRELGQELKAWGYVDNHRTKMWDALSLTTEGVLRARGRASMIERDIRENGQSLTIARGGVIVNQVVGVKAVGKGYFVFRPGVDVRTNDEIRTVVGDAYYVVDIDDVPREAVMAHFETQVERDRRLAASQPSSTTINMRDAYGPNINTGTQRDVSMTAEFDFRSIEQEIDQRGGADAEELRQALAEIRAALEQDGTLRQGMLARFGRAMRENTWFTSHVGQEIVEWMGKAAGG